ncbi:MAG: hypothetical protein JWR77_2347 [Rhizorhabdus sp.]|nr:hypothetical protein [Rhizorhabdus sp.]
MLAAGDLLAMKPDHTPASQAGAAERLRELAKARGVALTALSRMIGEDSAYLARWAARKSPPPLPARSRQLLATFLRAGEHELGEAADG